MRGVRLPPGGPTAAAVLLVAGCLAPADRSDSVRVELEAFPVVPLGDTVRLAAVVRNDRGEPVAGAAVRFASPDSAVALVEPDGRLIAVGLGRAVVTAWAVGFEDAGFDVGTVTVGVALSVDSLRPTTVRFGEVLRIHGIGLNPDRLSAAFVGAVEAPVAGYEPSDARNPNGVGVLEVWVPPPAPPRAAVVVIGARGSAAGPESITVIQEDLFEPNDSLPADLGALPSVFRNPALALEAFRSARSSTDWPRDLYVFTNRTRGDRTIVVRSRNLWEMTFGIALFLRGTGWGYWGLGIPSWLLTDWGAQICRDRLVLPSWKFGLRDSVVFALKDLPAGSYHLYVIRQRLSAIPGEYELRIEPSYRSTLPPDEAEENDHCLGAAPIGVPTAAREYTLDHEGDQDWFRFSLRGAKTVTITVEPPRGAGVMFDVFRFDTTMDFVGGVHSDSGPARLSAALSAGDYAFLVSGSLAVRYHLSIGVSGSTTRAVRPATGGASPLDRPAHRPHVAGRQPLLRALDVRSPDSRGRRLPRRPS